MKRFWLLDLNEGTLERKPCIRLWGIDEENARVLVVADQISPYFYYLPKEDCDAAIARLTAEKDHFPKISALAKESRKLLGVEREVLRVVCTESSAVSLYAKQLPMLLGGRSFDDLRLSERYLTDLSLAPCGWNECDNIPVEVDDTTDASTHRAVTPPRATGSGALPPPKLRVLAFTILTVGQRGSATPERDPIQALAVATDSETSLFRSLGDDDSKVLSSFTRIVQESDPDVIVGFGTNKSEWPYLIKRAKIKKTQLKLGRDNSEPHTSLYGHVSIAGRANLDLADLAADSPEIEVKTLRNLCLHYDLSIGDTLNDRDEWATATLWRDHAERNRVLKDLKLSAQGCLKLTHETINYPAQLSAATGLPLDHVLTASSGFRVDFYILRTAHRLGELIPSKNEQPFLTYRGALVQDPKPGLHANVAVLDFSSMYPRLMMKYNLSPDTLVRPDEVVSPNEAHTIPEVGHRFRKEPDGFYKVAVKSLIDERARVTRELQSASARSTIGKVLRERERTVKVVTNACYGYAGWAGARWYVREVAESAAALGRQLITETIERAKQIGLQVIYSDTDSIFVTYDRAKVQELMEWVNKDRDLEIRVEEEYVRLLFTEAMKRYAGLRRDNTLDIVGLEVVRGDWSEIARKVQKDVLRAILENDSTNLAIEKLRETLRRMQKGELPIEDFVIRRTLTRPIEKYRVRVPHVEVARKAAAEGWQIAVGDKVAYVIVKGQGALFQRARSVNNAALEDLDLEYYEENQVKPAALRILEVFGTTERDIGS